MVKRARLGFTIVELIVVIVVIGILASITYVSYSGITKKARITSLTSDLGNASLSLQKYRAKNGSFPASLSDISDIKASDGVSFSYYKNGGFCLEATSGDATYHVVSNSTTPVEGSCGAAATFVSEWVPSGEIGRRDAYSGSSAIQTSDGGYAMTGYAQVYNGYSDGAIPILLVKYDKFGNLSWSKTWGNFSGIGKDTSTDLIQTSDGGYAITGATDDFTSGNRDMFLAKYNSNGGIQWLKTWGELADECGRSLIQTKDGGYMVVGNTASNSNSDVFLAKFDASGNLSWDKSWGNVNYQDNAFSVIQVDDGSYVVTGGTKSFSNSYGDAFLAKFDNSGNTSWIKTWGNGYSSIGSKVISTSDGGFAVVGNTYAYIDSHTLKSYILFTKFDNNGNISWGRIWDSTWTFGDDCGVSIAQSNDGGYVVNGLATESHYGANWLYGFDDYDTYMPDEYTGQSLIKYDSTGSMTWSKAYSFGLDQYSSFRGYIARSIAKTNDGGYVSAGYAGVELTPFVSKYDSGGNIAGCVSPICETLTSTTSSNLSVTATAQTLSSVSQNITANSQSVTVNSPSITPNVIYGL